MLKHIRVWNEHLRVHPYGLTFFAFLVAAGITGAGCTLFARGFEFVIHHQINLEQAGPWVWFIVPVAILAAAELISRMAPQASGTGIPQTIFLSRHGTLLKEKNLYPLFAPRTIVIKVVAIYIGLWAGASTGREGPTVHVAAGL